MTSPKPVKKVPIHLQSAQNRFYIKNGKVVNHDKCFKADVYIEDGIIKYVGDASDISIPGGVRIIDASEKLIIPGGVDPHTHMQLSFGGAVSVDDFYHGTKAAVAGGTTTIIDFVLPKKGESLLEALDRWRNMADPKVCCDYALHMGITWWSKSVSDEIEIVCKEGGINSFKMFMAYKGLYQISDFEMLEAMDKIRDCEAIALVHAENGDIIARNVSKLLAAGITGPEGHEFSRQEEVEAEAVNRACVLAHQTHCPLYVVHIMSKAAGVELVRARLRFNDHSIYGETLAATLGSTGAHGNSNWLHKAAHIMSPPLRLDPTTPDFVMKLLAKRNGYYVCGEILASSVGCLLNTVATSDKINYITSPPIRNSVETPRQLMKALAYDDLQTTASDNCTFNKHQKEMGSSDFSKIPNGVNGVEDRMSIVWEKGVNTGLLHPCRFVAVTSTNAAKIFNLYPQKGHIGQGSDADIVIWNPKATRIISKDTHHHNCDFNIFEGAICRGVPEIVMVRGRICVENNAVHVAEGFGRFISRSVRCPFVYEFFDNQFNETEKQIIENSSEKLYASHQIESSHHEKNEVRMALESSTIGLASLPSNTLSSSRRLQNDQQKNMQKSTFSLTEELDKSGQRACIKVKNPPGGKSSGFW